MYKGKWNYSEDVNYEFVTYEVQSPATPTWWYGAFVGQTRQGILVTTENKDQFLIDNQHGDGYNKILSNGCPGTMHKSVSEYELKGICDPESEIRKLNHNALIDERKTCDFWLKENHPEVYEKSMALRDLIENRKR